MEIGTVTSLISSLGFPIVCVIALGYFSFYMVKETNKTNIARQKLANDSLATKADLYNKAADRLAAGT